MKRITLILCILWMSLGWGESPDVLYLSWQRDPSTTMTIQWHSLRKEVPSVVFLQKSGGWDVKQGESLVLEGSKVVVNTVELSDLEADKEYSFRVGDDKKVYCFRTMPKEGGRAIRFAVGGDVYFYQRAFRKMNQQIASFDPDFVIVGGDVAYTHGRSLFFSGKSWKIRRWQTFFKQWKKQMIGKGGRLIPMIVLIGNHDTRGKEKGLFYELFAFPKKGEAFRMLDVGPHLSLSLLDSGHQMPIEGQQTEWLKEALEARAAVPFKLAAYHVAGYPSVYSFEGKTPSKIRQYWSPIFERSGVQAAFEHHNHAFKRTHPIKEGKIDPKGVVYLGDGSWGVSPRKTKSPQSAWYLAKAARENAFWLVEVEKEQCSFRAFDANGRCFDTLTLAAH